MVVTLLRLLILLEPEAGSQEGLLRDASVGIGDSVKKGGLILSGNPGCQQDEVGEHLLVVDKASRARVKVAKHRHEVLDHIVLAPLDWYAGAVAHEALGVIESLAQVLKDILCAQSVAAEGMQSRDFVN